MIMPSSTPSIQFEASNGVEKCTKAVPFECPLSLYLQIIAKSIFPNLPSSSFIISSLVSNDKFLRNTTFPFVIASSVFCSFFGADLPDFLDFLDFLSPDSSSSSSKSSDSSPDSLSEPSESSDSASGKESFELRKKKKRNGESK